MPIFIPPVVALIIAVMLAMKDPRRVLVGVLGLWGIIGIASNIAARLFTDINTGLGETYIPAAIALTMAIIAVLLVLTLTGLLIYNGIVMIKRESIAPAHLLSLGVGLVLVGYIVLVIMSLYSGDSMTLMFWMLLAFPLQTIAFFLIAYITWAWLYGRIERRLQRPASAVIVLGAGVAGGIRPLLAARINTATDWAKRIDAPLLCSGGQGPDEPTSEAEAMAEYAIAKGFPRERVMLERKSTTTEENLLFSRDIVGTKRPVAVVTSNYHSFRAALLMRELGLPGYSIGAPVARYYWPSAMLREFIAVCRDHIKVTATVLFLSCVPLFTGIFFLVTQL